MARRWLMQVLQSSSDPSLWGPGSEAYIEAAVKTHASAFPLQDPPPGWINVRNGWLIHEREEVDDASVVKAGEYRYRFCGHTPGIRVNNQLPWVYDPAASCPALRRFQSLILPEGPPDFLAEVVAWCLNPLNPRQKALLLLGPKGNGKSTFLRIVQTFLGKANFSVDSLHSLTGNRFALEQLWGKQAHICPDLPKDKLPGMDIFKQLTGDDPVGAERKWRDRHHFHSRAKLLFSSNGPPWASGADGAFWRRWHLVPFEANLLGADRRPMDDIMSEMTSPAEMSGLLNWALSVAPRVWRNGVTETQAHRDLVEMCSHLLGITDHWATESVYPCEELRIEVSSLPGHFNNWCKRRGHSPDGYGTHDLVAALARAGGKWRGPNVEGLDWIPTVPDTAQLDREMRGLMRH